MVQDVKNCITDLRGLPSQPVVIQKLQALMTKQNANSHEVARIIETDQGFTARVLKLVNSSFYGLPRSISSVDEAITILGFNSVHQLLLTTSILNSIKIEDESFELSEFWKHSFAVGVIAKHLLAKRSKDEQDEAFISGVLHDIGKLIMVNNDSVKFAEFFSGKEKATNLKEENEYFGMDHQSLGELLAKKWNFPEKIRITIGSHHQPIMDSENTRLIACVYISDIIAHAMDIGNSGTYYISEFSCEAWKILDIKMDDLKSFLSKACFEINETEQLLSDLN
ncbi:MAG: HDOD domain-containing protein [candidate division Zixibacteria bacterium]